MNENTPVAVIAGGLSFEREVSLRSGRRIADALRGNGYHVVELDADGHLVEALKSHDPAAVFLALHGKFGEDGAVPAMLDILGVPYTGSDFYSCRLAFDKLASKAVLARARVRVPEAVPISEAAVRELEGGVLLDRAARKLGGYPLIVKPNRSGSALGIRLVENTEQLRDALIAAFSYDDLVLLERRICGTELAVAVLDGMPSLPIVEVRPKHNWLDYAARYTHGTADFIIPADLDKADAVSCAQIARIAHRALGCRDLSRVDMVLDSEGTSWVLEVSPSPGFAETSLLPLAIEAAGLTLGAVAGHLVERAVARMPR